MARSLRERLAFKITEQYLPTSCSKTIKYLYRDAKCIQCSARNAFRIIIAHAILLTLLETAAGLAVRFRDQRLAPACILESTNMTCNASAMVPTRAALPMTPSAIALTFVKRLEGDTGANKLDVEGDQEVAQSSADGPCL